MIIFGGPVDPYRPSLPANLCDLCRYVTFNDANEDGDYLCKVCTTMLNERTAE